MDDILNRLSRSKFRSSFYLKDKDIKYINEKGIDVIRSHARDFINKRLKPDIIDNDGRQTPMKGHPVFIAQHACACCCRECLYKWHKIPKGKVLSDEEVSYIIDLLIKWILKEMDDKK